MTPLQPVRMASSEHAWLILYEQHGLFEGYTCVSDLYILNQTQSNRHFYDTDYYRSDGHSKIHLTHRRKRIVFSLCRLI